VKIENGRLALQSSPTELTGLALDANWKNGQLVVDKLTVTADEGTASATARATLTGSRLDSLSAHLSTHRYPVSQQGLSAWLDSEIDVNAQRAGAHTKIQVAIRKALIELPELASEHPLQSIGPMDDVLFVGQAAEEAKPPPDIEVAITTPGAIQVRSPEAKLDLRLDLRVARAVGGLGVWGHIDGPNGQLTLLGRRYAVDRLHVSFDGAARPNPTLDVRVTRPMSDALMMVDVHGTANAPQVTFRSDPPIYTESQVLGEFISGDSESASVSTRSLDQQAIGAVSSLVVGKLKNELAPKLPIDLIKIDVGNEGYTDAGGAVEAGKYLTDNLYLAYVHQFGSAPGSRPINHNEGRLDLRFLRHMLLETHFGDAAVGGIDVFWTRRF
jgi:translocation and assembly module TamB